MSIISFKRFHRLRLLVVPALVAAPLHARAADAPPAAPTSSPASAPAPAPTAPAAAPSDIVAEEARARYRRGLELFDEGDYRLALVELERAYALHPSYKLHYNIAQVHFQLNEYAKARIAFERYLSEGGTDVPDTRRAEVERDLATLRTRVATLTVRVNVEGADVYLNDQPIGRAPIERLLVDAGAVRVHAVRPGYSTQARVLKLAGGDESVVSLELARATQEVVVKSDGMSGLAIGGWITTGALAAGAVGFGIAASSAASSYESKRDAPITGSPADAGAELERQRSLVNGLALTTDILIGTAVVAAGVSVYLTLREKPSSSTPRVTATGRSVALSMGF